MLVNCRKTGQTVKASVRFCPPAAPVTTTLESLDAACTVSFATAVVVPPGTVTEGGTGST